MRLNRIDLVRIMLYAMLTVLTVWYVGLLLTR